MLLRQATSLSLILGPLGKELSPRCKCRCRCFATSITESLIQEEKVRTRLADVVDNRSGRGQGQGQGQEQRMFSPEFEKDAHPFRSLFPWKSKTEFAESLVKAIVHDGDGVVVVNKPMGVGVVKPKIRPGSVIDRNHLRGIGSTDYSLEGAIPYLRKALDRPDLVLAKGTERMTSGLSVFADNLKYAEKFLEYLRKSRESQQMPLYKYVIITASSPLTNKRVFHEKVGIRLVETPLQEFVQPVIDRKYSKNSVKRQDIKPIPVRTTFLKYGLHKTTLVKIEVTSIVHNFLRVYFADLLVPILGDHLYSSRVQTIMGVPTRIDISHTIPGSADQKLSPQILDALGVKQSIEVPPHMHLMSYTVFNYKGKGDHLNLNAPLPSHFEWSQQRLNLAMSGQEILDAKYD